MNVENRTITYKGIHISYIIQYKKMKNMNIRINEQGQIEVHCNPYIPKYKIDELVINKLEWIIKNQRKVINKQNKLYEEGDSYFYLLNKKLDIKYIPSKTNKVTYDSNYLYVYYKDEKDIHKNILKFIDLTCKKIYPKIVDYYYEKLKDYKIPYPKIYYKNMTSRWGSCTPKKGNISLNKRMLHYDQRFLEYVVLHELVHFIQPNHSKNFYKIIAYHMHDYKERIKLVNA